MSRFLRSSLVLAFAGLIFHFSNAPAHTREAAAREQKVQQRAEASPQKLIPASALPWEQVGSGYEFLGGIAVNARGDLFFNDTPAGKTYVIPANAAANEPESFLEESGHARGLAFGPDGRLYAAASGEKKIVVYDGADSMEVLTDALAGADIVVHQGGALYVTQNGGGISEAGNIWLLRAGKVPRTAHAGLGFFSGLALDANQNILYAAESATQSVCSYSILPDGLLEQRRVFFKLPWPPETPHSRACGLHRTPSGLLLLAGPAGIHVCDSKGQELRRFTLPDRQAFSVALAGSHFEYLYAGCGDRLYRRKLRSEDLLQKPLSSDGYHSGHPSEPE